MVTLRSLLTLSFVVFQGQGLQGGPAVQQRDRTKSGRKSAKSNHRASNTALQRRDSTTESDDNHAIGNKL